MKVRYILLIGLIFGLISCSNHSSKTSTTDTIKNEDRSEQQSVFTGLDQAIFVIKTYDDERIMETGQAFLITPTTIVAPFSLFSSGANRAVLSQINGSVEFEIEEFYGYDRINNLILLKTDNLDITPLKLFGGKKILGLKTTVIGRMQNNRRPLYKGSCSQEQILEGRKLLSISNVISKRNFGAPILLNNGTVLGMGLAQEVMYEMEYFAVPVSEILALLDKRKDPKSLNNINSPNAARNSKIEKIDLITDFGIISIRLFNETPAYRDNFVKLAEEGFYDSLLIHRVIRNFGIQTGAADTRHAKHDDIVGWKGPGYTIPANIAPEHWHKRGAIGSPRKPDDKNNQRRSDGSQFYIVTGRKYFDDELDEFEKENNIIFTAEQREYYKTVGGAPHLDGSYTVFGEVISGLDIADRMTLLPVKGDFRPITDIRLKKVVINY